MQVIRKLFVLLCMTAFAASALAQVQQARGKASVTYTGKSAPPEAKAKALADAQMKAVEFYYAEAGESASANFDGVRSRIAENPDRYILETTVITEEDNAASRQYTVVVRVALNVANLRNLVKSNSAVGAAQRGERSRLAFLFVSRQVDSTTSYDPRISKRVDRTTTVDERRAVSNKGTEGERIGRGRVSTDDSSDSKRFETRTDSDVVESGGKEVRRASESTWRLLPSGDLNQVFTSVFSGAGYRVSEAAFVEPAAGGRFRVAQVENDYRSGNDLQSATLQAVASGMQAAKVPYFALGSLDLGLADRDPATGLMRVSVTVNARVLDATQGIPDTIASVGPVQYAGTGPTEGEARTNALRLAANNAARELSGRLTELGLR